MEKEIFKLEALFTPQQFILQDYPRVPISAFNPAAYNLPETDDIVIFPRLVFDDQFYVSSIGVCAPISLNKLSSVKTITTRLLAFPSDKTDFKGLEDPRITEDGKKMLHVAHDEHAISRTVLSEYHNGALYNSRPLVLASPNESTMSGCDAALINDDYLVFRPELEDLTSYSVPYDQNGNINFKESYPVLSPYIHELKRGFSTNVVKLSSDAYLIGWHTVLRRNLEYANGFMLLSGIGEDIGISKPFFRLPNTMIKYGNRPNTLFGCGLILHHETLYWVGGIGDWSIGIFSTPLEKVLECVK